MKLQFDLFFKKTSRALATLLVLGLYSPAQSQTTPRQTADQTHAWFAYTGSHRFAKKWSLHLEGSLRRSDFLAARQQFLFRTGINFHLNPGTMLTAGYCWVETYPYGEFPAKSTFPEHRWWEQLQLRTQLDRFEWVSRFRLEQRLVNQPVAVGAGWEPGDAVYTNRFRVMNRFSIPLRGKTIEERSFYLTFFDEIMVNFGKNVALNVFDQNRAYAGIGYRIPKIGRLEVAYLNQLIVRSDGVRVESNHTLHVALAANFDFRKL